MARVVDTAIVDVSVMVTSVGGFEVSGCVYEAVDTDAPVRVVDGWSRVSLVPSADVCVCIQEGKSALLGLMEDRLLCICCCAARERL